MRYTKYWQKITKLFGDHPLLSWNLFAAFFVFIWWPLSVLFVFLSLIAWARHSKKKREEETDRLISEAQQVIEEVKAQEKIPTILTDKMLNSSEEAFLEESSEIAETRAVRKTTGGGAGVRIMKGVYLGGYRGRGESHQEWRSLDTGTLTLTNKRLIFDGEKEDRTIKIDKLISVQPFFGGFEISQENRKRSIQFRVENPFKWAAFIRIIHAVEDPKDLSSMNLDVSFKQGG